MMIRRPPRSTRVRSSAASDVYKRQVSVCLSKGLGTPAGSVLCGSRAHIGAAHRWRKMLGGGMRQAGVLAAAGLYALDHNIERLADDHRNAARLASGLAQVPELKMEPPQAKLVFVHIA